MRNVVGSEFARQFAGGVGAHAIGDHQQMAAVDPFGFIVGDYDRERIRGLPEAEIAALLESARAWPAAESAGALQARDKLLFEAGKRLEAAGSPG